MSHAEDEQEIMLHPFKIIAKVEFSVQATSIPNALKELEKLMVSVFNDSWDGIGRTPTGEMAGKPKIVPSQFDTVSIEKVGS